MTSITANSGTLFSAADIGRLASLPLVEHDGAGERWDRLVTEYDEQFSVRRSLEQSTYHGG
jgi:hypothetical protein